MTDALLLAVAAATGAAVMIIELMAVRLLAPWFGQTLPVWTNVIGVVLLALAVGQWLGGRWAEAGRGYKPTSLLLVAGALSIALPDLVAWLAPATLPDDLTLEAAYPFVTLGSLLVALPVIGVPMAAMGAVAPWLVKLSQDARQRPGGVSGRVLAAGTAGSLLGAFGATYVLLGAVGSVLSVRLAGGLLVLAALTLWRAAARSAAPGRASLSALLVPVVGALLPPVTQPESVLDSAETPYQFARVVRDQDGTVLLRLNEGLDSFHSAYRPDSIWTNRYFDAFVAPALLSQAAPDGRRSVLVVGMGAGTMARQSIGLDPTLEVVGVEPDAELTALGRRWFGLPDDLVVHDGLDGRVALQLSERRWGAILVDAYAQQMYLPHHLCTREFFALLRSRLLAGGVAALNLGGRTREDPVVAAVSATFAGEFDGATMARVPGTRNWILLGWNGGSLDRQQLERRLQETGAAKHLDWFLTGDLFAPVRPDASSELVDGDDPVEALADASWRGHMSAGCALILAALCTNGESLEQARSFVRQGLLREAEGLLRPLAESAEPTDRARALLLLGNVDYERGLYDQALERYDRAANDSSADDSTVAAARSNRVLAEERVRRATELSGLEHRLRASLAATLVVAASGIAWMARRARAPSPER